MAAFHGGPDVPPPKVNYLDPTMKEALKLLFIQRQLHSRAYSKWGKILYVDTSKIQFEFHTLSICLFLVFLYKFYAHNNQLKKMLRGIDDDEYFVVL